MERIDAEQSEGKIEKFLLQDSLFRNKYLDRILSFLNNIEGQLILNIDDNWGTGKTVFLKQLEYLNRTQNENIPNIPLDKINDFKRKYDVFYFNAWEHDLYNNPLESLINSLLMKMLEMDEEQRVREETFATISNLLKRLGTLGMNTVIKSISSDVITVGTLKMDTDDLCTSITSTDVKRNAINEIIQTVLKTSNKKLLIIIDELDRCKPTFAVELLEIIKHFFINDDVVFLFGTNKKELSETIRGKYGHNFDGYKYLNRFFDFEFSLPDYKIDDYINLVGLMNYSGSQAYTLEMKIVAKYFDFTLRDINRYVSICDMCHNYWRISDYYVELYHKCMIIPFAVGLKIHSGSEYQKFITGKGRDILEKYYEYDTVTHNKMISRTLQSKAIEWKTNTELEDYCRDELLSFYNVLNKTEDNNDDSAYAMSEILEILSMMSSHTN